MNELKNYKLEARICNKFSAAQNICDNFSVASIKL